MSAHARLYKTALWLRRRAAQLRSEPLCRFCAAEGRITPAEVADHVEPHGGDQQRFMGRLQSLCKPCHDSRKKQIEERGYYAGCDVHGMPLDPNHPWYRAEQSEPGGTRGRGTPAARTVAPPPEARLSSFRPGGDEPDAED